MKIKIKLPKWMIKKEEVVVQTNNLLEYLINFFSIKFMIVILSCLFAGWLYADYFNGNFWRAFIIEIPIAYRTLKLFGTDDGDYI